MKNQPAHSRRPSKDNVLLCPGMNAAACTQVNFCVFSLTVCQCFSSIVLPVSVSFDVEGQRTSKLLRLGPVFALGRRGGSNKNLVAISESINNSRFGGVVR